MGALTKCIASLIKPIKTLFCSILPKVMVVTMLVICVVCKHYKRASFRYKYASIIKHKGSEYVLMKKNLSYMMDSLHCVVCLSEAAAGGGEAMELTCGHVFHQECLDMWLRCYVATCPLCRRVVLPPDMVEEYLMARDGKEDNNGIQMELALFLVSTLDHRRCNEFS